MNANVYPRMNAKAVQVAGAMPGSAHEGGDETQHGLGALSTCSNKRAFGDALCAGSGCADDGSDLPNNAQSHIAIFLTSPRSWAARVERAQPNALVD